MKITYLPQTNLGKTSVILFAIFIIAWPTGAFFGSATLLERVLQSGLIFGGVFAVLGGAVTGIIALFKKDFSILLLVVTLLNLFMSYQFIALFFMQFMY